MVKGKKLPKSKKEKIKKQNEEKTAENTKEELIETKENIEIKDIEIKEEESIEVKDIEIKEEESIEVKDKICEYCKLSIQEGEDYLGNPKIGFIHTRCLQSHMKKIRIA